MMMNPSPSPTRPPVFDVGYMTRVYIEQSGYLGITHLTDHIFNITNVVVAEFGKVMGTARGIISTTLLLLILHIRFGGAKKKMRRIDAEGYVASMANICAVRDRPPVQSIRVSVRPYRLDSVVKRPITVRTVSSTLPYPTSGSLLSVEVEFIGDTHSRRSGFTTLNNKPIVMRVAKSPGSDLTAANSTPLHVGTLNSVKGHYTRIVSKGEENQ